MKKIGFVDYYISEWHAENYPAWIKNASATLGGEEFSVAYAWAELDLSPKTGETTAQWCERQGIEMCGSIDELCEKSDCIVVLAPTDPETHPRLAEAVLKHGKRTYIDKTFAANYADAEYIFSLSEKYGAPFFTSSALRYADELVGHTDYDRVETTGGGSNAPEYIIHQVEMVVKMLGVGANAVSAKLNDEQIVIDVEYSDGRSAAMTYSPSMNFTCSLSKSGAENKISIDIKSDFFTGLITDMIRFFKEGTPSFDPAETLEVMKIREAALKAVDAGGVRVKL
jgi:predicted dehydrogenase